MAVAGLRGTGDWGTDERPKNFRESILWMEPNGDSPMLALSARAKGKKKSVDDPEFSWWNEPVDNVRLQVDAAFGSGDTLITVDSADPTAGAIKVGYGKATHLVPGDILMVEPAVDNVTDDFERMVVVSVLSETSFTVQRGAVGSAAASIADDQFLLLIGSAFAEGTAEPSSVTRNPVKFVNKTQIFKTSYEITGTAEQTHARTGDIVANDKRRRMFDHSRGLEWAI